MKCFTNDDVVISKPLDGPLSEHIAGFAKWSQDEGYAVISRHRQVLLATCFSRWLGQQSVSVHYISSDHPTRYLRYRARHVKIQVGDGAALKHLMDYLYRKGVVIAEKVAPRQMTPIELAVHSFENYLRNVHSLTERTIVNYLRVALKFLIYRFGNGPVKLSHMNANDVVEFVQSQALRIQAIYAKTLTTALRSFLRYARYHGDIALDLAAAVPAVANWSMTSIPRAISSDSVRQVLASINRRTANGQRDYAILLLLARLGLRASEVTGLELDDIDWNSGFLNVKGKGGQRSTLPLPAEVGAAIAAYLRHGRPRSSSRRVFLRSQAPISGVLTYRAVGSIVRRTLARTGIKAPTTGTHQFRHSLATEMLHHGASLTEIGQILRHRSPETTMIYTKIDLDALRTLALPWPGGVR